VITIFTPWASALAAIVVIALVAWLASLLLRDVGFVDGLWSLFFLVSGLVAGWYVDELGNRAVLVLALLTLWSLRLSLHIFVRSFGEPEDYRYREMRERHQPFALKSLYIVFGLQGVLAWLIALPLVVSISQPAAALGWIDLVATLLWLVGFVFEAGGDWQLARFRNDPANRGKVLDTGLWRYTRHPNYFGDFCIWWAYYLFAVAAGGWWTILSPLLMSFLLLKVSGVALLEKSIGSRRPGYAEYVASTNAFFPGPRQQVRAVDA